MQIHKHGPRFVSADVLKRHKRASASEHHAYAHKLKTIYWRNKGTEDIAA